MNIIYIEGTKMPSPTKYSVKLADIDSSNSGRGDTGYLTRERLRSDVANIDIGWEFLTTEELNIIKTSIANPEFIVKFFIGGEGDEAYKEAQMYAGDRSIELVSLEDGEERWNISFPLTEL
jgi:hypothetical protein